MTDSPTPVSTTIGESIKRWWAAPAGVKVIVAAATLAAALPALLLVPLLLTTATALLAPSPWGVPVPQCGPVIFAAFVGWVALPFAVGAWRRRWWWPPLCLATVLATAASWGGELIVGGSGEYGYGVSAATVEMTGPALALGALAALMSAAGVALALTLDRLGPRVRHWIVAAGLTAGIVPVIVASVVTMAVRVDAGLAETLSALILLVAAINGPYQAGRWIGQWWWVLACLVIPVALFWYWATPYVDAVPKISTGFLGLVIFIVFAVVTAIAAGMAAIGVWQKSSTGLALPRGGPFLGT